MRKGLGTDPRCSVGLGMDPQRPEQGAMGVKLKEKLLFGSSFPFVLEDWFPVWGWSAAAPFPRLELLAVLEARMHHLPSQSERFSIGEKKTNKP